jgi:uncharacterized alpha-E superfamily protein
MLSRVAESLYWMARYIERAEDLTRLLAVNFNALLDTQPEVARQGWQPLVTMTGDEELFTANFGEATALSVMEFMLWEGLNPNAITTCIGRARENARSVREQISSEVWEHINRLYFMIRETSRATVLANPTEFFSQVRDGSQAFQGITAATMTHAEPYHFIQLGSYLERADKTARILNAKYLYINNLALESAETALQLIALLRSCSAFEPFRRTARGELNIEMVVNFLLLDRSFPRAVLFCLNRGQYYLETLGSSSKSQPGSLSPRRSLGRMSSDLEYLDIHEVLGGNMDPYLQNLLVRLNAVDNDIANAYFTTRVILPDSRPQQQQQQQ